MKILGPPIGYTDLLDLGTIEKIKEEAANKGFPLRPSSAGSCGRKLAYELTEHLGKAKYEQPLMEPNTHRLLNLGHSVEYSALRNFEALAGFKQRYKQQVVSLFKLPKAGELPERLVEGSMDVVLWSEEHKCVLDVKSTKDGWSVAYKSRWDDTLAKYSRMRSLVKLSDTAFYADDLQAFINELDGDFVADNMLQLNLYACSDFLVERGITHAVIYKYNKNTSQHYEIRFRPSMKVLEATKDKFNRVYRAIGTGAGPEAVKQDASLGSMRCAFCPYSKQCWSEDSLKAWFKGMPKKDWPKDASYISKEMPKLFDMFEQAASADSIRAKYERDILTVLVEKGITKVRLSNGNIYECKHYKSPQPHFALKRSKL
jgi:hypothetical protein